MLFDFVNAERVLDCKACRQFTSYPRGEARCPATTTQLSGTTPDSI
ncbi:hypothetical protein F3J17_02595 [Burkholderia sp. Ax-1719]|nr:hypothetical protein [Burkholderia sp. Ax-1719]